MAPPTLASRQGFGVSLCSSVAADRHLDDSVPADQA